MLWDSLQGWELIDTWWDVNKTVTLTNELCSTELIDTWWDVNSPNALSATCQNPN